MKSGDLNFLEPSGPLQACNGTAYLTILYMLVPVAVQSKMKVCGRSPAEIVGLNPTGGMDVCLLWVLCVVR